MRAQGHFTQEESPVPRTITGIKPTGRPHLGNYLGMIRPALELARTSEALCFIADYHALTAVPPPETIRAGVLDLAATLIAFGLDPERTVLYRQSDVPEICELTWILGCVCPKGLLNRAHAYKAAVQENVAAGRDRDQGVGMGLFNYPILMAADILSHRADLVPVGSDQRQHVEIARDLAESFNRRYGPVLVVPEPAVDDRVMTIPGIDGRKMSKSYGNQITLCATPDEIRRQVSRIVTDSRSPSEPKDPDTDTRALPAAGRCRACRRPGPQIPPGNGRLRGGQGTASRGHPAAAGARQRQACGTHVRSGAPQGNAGPRRGPGEEIRCGNAGRGPGGHRARLGLIPGSPLAKPCRSVGRRIREHYETYSRYVRYVISVITGVKTDASGTAGTLHTVIPIRGGAPPASSAPAPCPHGHPGCRLPSGTHRYPPVPGTA